MIKIVSHQEGMVAEQLTSPASEWRWVLESLVCLGLTLLLMKPRVIKEGPGVGQEG